MVGQHSFLESETVQPLDNTPFGKAKLSNPWTTLLSGKRNCPTLGRHSFRESETVQPLDGTPFGKTGLSHLTAAPLFSRKYGYRSLQSLPGPQSSGPDDFTLRNGNTRKSGTQQIMTQIKKYR